jgi:galactokinase
MLKEAGYQLKGANLLINGEVPIGSGLSSSAAIEVATGFALLDSAGCDMDRKQLALLCQQAENEFVGMRCGLMDQFVSCFAEEGRALMLDCRSLEYQTPPLPASTRIVVCNTMVKHELAASEYNVRRAECEGGVRLLAEELPGIKSLRDVDMADLERFESKLPEKVLKRCRHVVSENARVMGAATALEGNDLELLGSLMNQSHKSLSDDFEVSCHELDVMVDLAQQQPGVFGARMTGGGFGGCTVNLVRRESVDEFRQAITRRYQHSIGIVPEVFVCSASHGVARAL